MELNEWDYEQLEKIVLLLKREKYTGSATQLKVIIRKIKRD